MPTFNQLVRKGRQTAVKKSTAPALQRTYNSLRKKAVEQYLHHRNVVFVQLLKQLHLRSLTQLLENCQSSSFKRNRSNKLHSRRRSQPSGA